MPIDSDLKKIKKALDDAESEFVKVSEASQERIFETVRSQITKIDTSGGRFNKLQDAWKHLARIQADIEATLKGDYTKSITRFFDAVDGTGAETIRMQKEYNAIDVPETIRKVARDDLQNRLNESLLPTSDAFRQGYTQPIKQLVYAKIRQGATIADMNKLLDKWHEGNPPAPGVKTLQSYSTQIARDAGFQHNGQINQIIADEYELNGWEYSGSKIADSRPFCVHMVDLDRPVLASEIAALIKRFPDGTIKGTNGKNFGVYRGGFGCRHAAFAVRIDTSAK